ncbi:class I SAM-dependent methyltransferase [Halomonas daqiaonensis]|uniref:Methyltransferase domain-containing protein n=1 Tax=Halomonas daqiaonensis TaxID=650850 RepID=A0A1H7VQY5_9GAMM|nr:class I SAM-dependent methyltransferase [Halomonas daqiaonensis]SEM11225.1 Methyltransferase domain-containing protein [Halomonas daqiaonensis]
MFAGFGSIKRIERLLIDIKKNVGDNDEATLRDVISEIGEKSDKNARSIKSYVVNSLKSAELRNYRQMESLHWLTNGLTTRHRLPPLRGWASSPDLLLELQDFVLSTKPESVVELGSGVSTLVIADALRQNGSGKLISLEHSSHYGSKTRLMLERDNLSGWVDLKIAPLESWEGEHLSDDSEEELYWYSQDCLKDAWDIDLLLVDGPPAATCKFSRYPAMPAIVGSLKDGAQVWMDDTTREEESTICSVWGEKYGFSVEFVEMEKGLGVLKKK